MDNPVPFEIHREADGLQVASNGAVRVVMDGPEGKLFRRRAITGIPSRSPVELVLPQLNALAGELLAQPDASAEDVVGRLLALAGMVPTEKPKRLEWLVAELNGVRVYTDGTTIVVSTKDLSL